MKRKNHEQLPSSIGTSADVSALEKGAIVPPAEWPLEREEKAKESFKELRALARLEFPEAA